MGAAAVVAIGLGLASYSEQRRAAREQERANKEQKVAAEAQRKIQELQARRQRTEEIRQRRVQQADVEQAAEGGGVAASSSAVAASQAVQTTLASNLSFLDQTAGLGTIATERLANAAAFQNRAIRAQNRAGQYSALSGLGFQAGAAYRNR